MTERDYLAEATEIVNDIWSNNSKHKTAEGCQQMLEVMAKKMAEFMRIADGHQKLVGELEAFSMSVCGNLSIQSPGGVTNVEGRKRALEKIRLYETLQPMCSEYSKYFGEFSKAFGIEDRNDERTASLVLMAIQEAKKVREYDEFFSQCIKVLGLSPGEPVPEEIMRALTMRTGPDRVKSPLPTAAERPQGLHQRYYVERLDGQPNDPKAVYFVLRIDEDETGMSEGRVASRFAAMAYSLLILRNECSGLIELAEDVLKFIGHDIQCFEDIAASCVLSFLAHKVGNSVMDPDNRKELMDRAIAWNHLMSTLGT